MRIVPALDRGLQIIEYVASCDAPPQISDVIEALGIPRSAVYELMHTLRERNYLEAGDDGRLHTGHRLFAVGSRYGQRLDIAELARLVAAKVRDEVNETIQVATLEGRHVLYIAKAEPTRMVRLVSSVGRRLPAHCTAIGKVQLAQLPDHELRALFDGAELESFTSRSITDFDELLERLHGIREDGVAHDDRESNEEVCCVAAPVFDVDGSTAAGISISVPYERMTADLEAELTGQICAAADELSARLGRLPAAAHDQRSQG